jgi:hypothetical protein
VQFGNVVHVSGRRGDLVDWLRARQLDLDPEAITPIPTGLEDVFISLTQNARDNFN